MDDVGERLGLFLKNKNVRPTAVEQQCGISNGLVGKAIKKQTHLSSEKIEKILSAYPDLSAEWLFRGTGDMVLDNDDIDMANNKLAILQDKVDKMERMINAIIASGNR